ncbi:MAG: trypsin-like peptidase domain-containing protein [Acidimicrobiales bacterium]
MLPRPGAEPGPEPAGAAPAVDPPFEAGPNPEAGPNREAGPNPEAGPNREVGSGTGAAERLWPEPRHRSGPGGLPDLALPGSADPPDPSGRVPHRRPRATGPIPPDPTGGTPSPPGAGGWIAGVEWRKLAGLAVAAVVVVAGIMVLTRSGRRSDAPAAGPTSEVAAAPIDDLARSAVGVVGLDPAGQPVCFGSGALVSADGLIVTTAQVATPGVECDFASLAVAIVSDDTGPADLRYQADLLTVDPEADLAVIKVARTLDGGAMPADAVFPALPLGDSDQLVVGAPIQLLGFDGADQPVRSIPGAVEGFTAQAGVGDRALIRTDAAILDASSGGPVVDAQGRLVAVSTGHAITDGVPSEDCRALSDTNGDGLIDQADNCDPAGGALLGLRPVNLIRPLVAAATTAEPQTLEAASHVRFSNPRFSLGVTEGAPTEIVRTATAGVVELCLFVDWAGAPEGGTWDGIWYHNGEVFAANLTDQTWRYGQSGHNLPLCVNGPEGGLEAGVYEIGFFVDRTLVFAEGFEVTEAPVEVLATTWVNDTGTDLCSLAVNPAGSGPAGLNELPDDTVLAPEDSIELELPAGEFLAEAADCDGQVVSDSAGAIPVNGNRTYFEIKLGS